MTSAELGSPPATHSTRLKDEILAEISDLQFHREGKQGYLASIQKFSNSNEIESKTLRDALRILCKDMFNFENRFNGSLLNQGAQTSSVPPQHLPFIRRLLGGDSEDDVMVMFPSLYVLLLSYCIPIR